MDCELEIPESYKKIKTVAIRSIGTSSDTVICTNEKTILAFYNGCLVKSCNVNIEANCMEPFIIYGPKNEYYYILYGENKVVVVKEESNLKVVKTYDNICQMVVCDNMQTGVPQLYLKSNIEFECVDFRENDYDLNTDNTNQEVSILYTFCVNKLQKLQLYSDNERKKLTQKINSFNKVLREVSNENSSLENLNDKIDFSSTVISKYPWTKLNNEQLMCGFTLQNKSKLNLPIINLLLLKDNEIVWPKFWYKFWEIKSTKTSIDFHSEYQNNCPMNNIVKSCLNVGPERSVIVTCSINNWSNEQLPYHIHARAYIYNINNELETQYINIEKFNITSKLFLSKEFDIFVNNSILVEDIICMYCTKSSCCYEIACLLNAKDFAGILIDDFKFVENNKWFYRSVLPCFKSLVCNLHCVSHSQYELKLFSESSVNASVFIQLLSQKLPEHTDISKSDDQACYSFDADNVLVDLRQLRSVLKDHVNEDGTIIIPRDKWNCTRSKLMIT
ncbi:uncharacterized protein LOC126846917 isoform X2 [Adelges cooleyi]|uniref:uncharacterized protein LOC126846917 isoform X2 n=1 Tax=Adelges cooleyi TaxID=133065 RepID=UPI00217F6C94|nr:uncharacterized protein LOC126846917 isoform X2 [Adelges cooleyi]